MSAIPRTTSTITRADGTLFTYEHVDHAAVLDRWDALGDEVWFLDVGDLHNVIDLAVERLAAAEPESETP